MCKIISVVSIKGGIGKTTTTVNLGTALAINGKKVLAVDSDPQYNLTTAFGIEPNETKLPDIFMGIIQNKSDKEIQECINNSIIKKSDNLDVIPSSLSMSALEIILPTAMSREYILKKILGQIKERYDFILIDNLPSLGLFSINALTASDSVIIPVEAHYLGTEGLRLVLDTIMMVKKNLNPNLVIEGIVFTKYQSRTNCCKTIREYINDAYGEYIKIFDEPVNYSIKVAESAACGLSILEYDPKGQPTMAYKALAREVIANVDS